MRRALAAVAVAVLASACGPSAPPKPPVPDPPQPLSAADVAGQWTATDADGWTYTLAITSTRYEQSIERGAPLGPCVQKGSLAPYESAYGAPYVPPSGDRSGFAGGGGEYGGAGYGGGAVTKIAFVLTLEENTCNPDFAGAQLVLIASDYHAASILLRANQGYAGSVEESHVYWRSGAEITAR
jgi:hypothetical protein